MIFESKHFNLLANKYHQAMRDINKAYQDGIPLSDRLMKAENAIMDDLDEVLYPYIEAKKFLSKGFDNFKFREQYSDENPMEYIEKKYEAYKRNGEIYSQVVDAWEKDGNLLAEGDDIYDDIYDERFDYDDDDDDDDDDGYLYSIDEDGNEVAEPYVNWKNRASPIEDEDNPDWENLDDVPESDSEYLSRSRQDDWDIY